MATVKKYETAGEIVDEVEDAFMYEDMLQGHDVYVLYAFTDDKLNKGVYKLNENLTTGGQYIEVMNSYKDMLIKKYGEPDPESGMMKYDDDLTIDLAGESSALEYGLVGYMYKWTTERSQIILSLTSKEYNESLLLVYSDLNYDVSEEDMDNF